MPGRLLLDVREGMEITSPSSRSHTQISRRSLIFIEHITYRAQHRLEWSGKAEKIINEHGRRALMHTEGGCRQLWHYAETKDKAACSSQGIIPDNMSI